jgi:SpoVK/Ycf46/Vps4 family AAA+-type ATPase
MCYPLNTHSSQLAEKLQPCIIFIDEVDAMLSKRGAHSEHEASLQVIEEPAEGTSNRKQKHGYDLSFARLVTRVVVGVQAPACMHACN